MTTESQDPATRIAIALERLADSADAAVQSDRDAFAMNALQGVAAQVMNLSPEAVRSFVSNAYSIADAMLAERSK